ncbi:hypothetical protein ACHAPE_003302 [Trichoderma viride]
MAFDTRLSLSLKRCSESPDEPTKVGCAAAMQPTPVRRSISQDANFLLCGHEQDYWSRVTSLLGLRMTRRLEEAGFSADLVLILASLAER